MPGRCGMPPAGRTGCDGQRPRTAQHRRGVALQRALLAERTLSLRTRQIARGRLRRTGRGRHHARRLRHDLTLGLQRRRARRRLAGLFDAQANARRHESAGDLFAHDFRHFDGRDGDSAGLVVRAARARQPVEPARRLDHRLGGRRFGDWRGRFDQRRRCVDGCGGDRLLGRGFRGLRLLDQARRSERGRGGLGRLRCGRGALLARCGLRLRGLDGLLREDVALRQRDVALLGEPIHELARDDLFERARRALELDAVGLLEQGQHLLGGGVEQLGDLVNPNSGQT